MSDLKRVLFGEYGGFADKRIKNLEKSDLFIADDRTNSDIGADGTLYSYFCCITAKASSEKMVHVNLSGNVPIDAAVRTAIVDIGANYSEDEYNNHVELIIVPGNEEKLVRLGDAIASIVAPGRRYKVANYKYVCPRTAGSLRRLASVLKSAWGT